MFRRNRELWYSLIAMLAVTAVYLLAYRQAGAFPAASGLVGHGIGVVGFILMLMAETLYSMRKMVKNAGWGSMAVWLRFHIVAGLVGPYMVLLHTTMKFNGLAGVATLMTVVVVVSGVVGRYIYTAAPHLPVEHAEKAGQAVLRSPASGRSALSIWHSVHVPLTWALFVLAFVHVAAALFYATLQR